MSVDHVSLPTGQANFNEMREFYLAALKPLGYKIYFEKKSHFLGLSGPGGAPDFWLHCGGAELPKLSASSAVAGDGKGPVGKAHVAFKATGRSQVDAWYKVAVQAGGIPNGEPGERAYVKGYYAAYILDPLGNNIEVVHFNPLWLQALKSIPTVVTLVVGGVLSQGAVVLGQRYGLL